MKALILVDIQNDFISGSLAVKDGDQVVPIANRLITSNNFNLTALTQDHHPPGHASFASKSGEPVGTLGELNGKPQVWWPDHCLWNSEGAAFHKNLMFGRANAIFRKGVDSNVDSYSGFFDNDGTAVGLGGYLKDRGVTDVYICGLATDYCIKFTALDSVKLGFKTNLILDGCRAVNIKPDDGGNAVKEMKKAGITIIKNSDTLTKREQ